MEDVLFCMNSYNLLLNVTSFVHVCVCVTGLTVFCNIFTYFFFYFLDYPGLRSWENYLPCCKIFEFCSIEGCTSHYCEHLRILTILTYTDVVLLLGGVFTSSIRGYWLLLLLLLLLDPKWLWFSEMWRHEVSCPSTELRGVRRPRSRPRGGGGGCWVAPPKPPKPKFKKHRFCRHYDIRSFTWFPLHPKSATEIGWWLYIRILKNKLLKFKKKKIGRCDWVMEHLVLVLYI
jgi:hypothetical protein